MKMRYWVFMFRPDTYEKVREHETVGVRHSVRKRFAAIAKGDRFVSYVSRKGQLDGYGTITSDPFEDDKMIFSDERVYPWRCKVSFDRNGLGVPVGDRLWGLSPFETLSTTTPANMLFCKGGFIEITEKDFQWLVREMEKK